MRLTIVAPLVVTYEGGTYRLNSNYGRWIEELAPHFRSVEVVAGKARDGDPTYYPDGKSLYTFPLPSGNVSLAMVRTSTASMSPVRKAGIWISRILPYLRAVRRGDLTYIAMPGFSGILAWLASRLAGKPYILYYGSDWPSLAPFTAKWKSNRSGWLSLYRRLAAWAEGAPVRRSLFALAAGRHLQERLRGYGPRVFETSPMGWLRPTDFHTRRDTCQNRPIRVLSVASLIPVKGTHTLIESIANCRSRGLNVTLVLAGPADPAYLDRLKALVRDLSLEPWVAFAGYVSEPEALLRLYRQADIFALATESEGFPRVLYEAMSQGLPVVTTSIPSIASALRDGREAVLVAPGSTLALAEGIERVATDAGLRGSLVEAGSAYSLAKLSSTTTAELIMSLLNEGGSAEITRRALMEWGRDYYSHSTAYEERLTSKWSEDWNRSFAPYIEAMIGNSPRRGRVLDLGCGGGQTSDMLRKSGRIAVGADLFLRVLRRFPRERRVPGLDLVNCDAAKLPFRDGAFAAVGGYAMLEHVADAEAVLDEMIRVLGVNGGLVIVGPNMLSPTHSFRLWVQSLRTGIRHPDGTPGAILWRLVWSLRKALSPRHDFLYREPKLRGDEFPGSDYDAVCMVNPFDLARWAEARGLAVLSTAEASSRGGRMVRALFPGLVGGLCFVARRTTGEPG